MLKIGIIGLGDIASKAYLPVISRKNLEVHLHTRNEERLYEVGSQYRYSYLHKSLDALIASGVKGVFVHSVTSSHYSIVEKLLNNDIHVYVDKPLTSDYRSTEQLINLAVARKLHLVVGFNRRYAPAYKKMKEVEDINMIIMQKNRKDLPGEARIFVFDDFIHVIDTILFLFPDEIKMIKVSGQKVDGLLHHVIAHFVGKTGVTAIGLMNRNSAAVEERIEVFSPTEKRVVKNVVDEFSYSDRGELRIRQNDWQSTLYKRGFEQIVDHFLDAIQAEAPLTDARAILHTHEVCEEVIKQLEAISSESV